MLQCNVAVANDVQTPRQLQASPPQLWVPEHKQELNSTQLHYDRFAAQTCEMLNTRNSVIKASRRTT